MRKILSLMTICVTSTTIASSGTLCLTFDDRYFASWESAIPLFAKYNAHVTFFCLSQN